MFHNVLMTTLTPIRDTNEISCWENGPFNTIWPDSKPEKVKDTSTRKTIKKKKRNRTMFTTEQVKVLEKIFARTKYIDVERRREVSEYLQIQQKCIKIWFQNRRMKEKKELSESGDSTSESAVESLSPPPESLHTSNNKSEKNYIPPHVHNHGISHYHYADSNYYLKPEEYLNENRSYEISSNSIIPDFLNYNYNSESHAFRNNSEYSMQYPPQTESQYYYNTGGIYNQCIAPNVNDWAAHTYNNNYF